MQCINRGLPVLLLVLGLTGVADAKPYEETQKTHSWLSFNRPAEHTSAGQLARAEKFRADGRLRAASRAYRALVTTWPGSGEAPVAQFHGAQVLQERGKLDDAFDAYQFLMDHYTGSFPYDQVLSNQFEIATGTMQKRRGKFLMFGGWKAPERAIPMFEKLIENGPRWEKAPECQYMIGRAYELSEQQDLAVASYLIVMQRYPDSPFARDSAFARARCWYLLSEDSPNDEESLEQAWTAVSIYLASYPDAEDATLAKEMKTTLLSRRARASYDKAIYYDKVAKKPKAALQSYQNFVKLFPNSEWTSLAQVRIEELSKQSGAQNEP